MSNQTFKDRVIAVWKETRPDIKSVRRLEEEIKLSNGSISSWSKSSPTQEKVQKVADFFGVSVDYLLGNTNEKNPRPAKNAENIVDLDKALSEEGMAMFDGQPLSEDYKKALLAMLKTMRGE